MPWCQVGQETELQVFYEGKPLAAEIKAVSRRMRERRWRLIKTDEQGIARIPVTTDGQWMFLARHRDPTKKVSDAFDESVFVNTLVMES